MQFVFDDHVLDTDRRELHCSGTAIAVEPQVFDLLLYLVENRERVVSKDDLIASVWCGRIVSESTLASRMNAARKAIGDNGQQQRLIRTLSRRGVRFIGAVRTRGDGGRLSPSQGSAAATPRPAIAVLPFLDAGGEAGQEHVANGIAEGVITGLGRLRQFLVIGRNTGEAPGAGYVVEGSVRKSGERVRITAQLSEPTGRMLWAERYERRLADVFALQDEVAEAIVAAIEPQLYAAESLRAQHKSLEELDARELVMRALAHHWRVTREDNRLARQLLERAVALNPDDALAQAALAVSHTFGAHMGWGDAAAAVAVAERAAQAAVRSDGDDPWAHLALATTHVHRGRFDHSLAEFEMALRLNPSFAFAQGYYGLVLSSVGRWQEGADAARRALRLSPRDPFSAIFSAVVAYGEFVGRNYEEAVRLARDSIRQRIDFVGGWRILTAAAAMMGDKALAREALQELLRVHPDMSLAWIERRMLVRDEAERRHYLQAFRRAGLE